MFAVNRIRTHAAPRTCDLKSNALTTQPRGQVLERQQKIVYLKGTDNYYYSCELCELEDDAVGSLWCVLSGLSYMSGSSTMPLYLYDFLWYGLIQIFIQSELFNLLVD